jgi:beta-lactamase regulating signal transducer with metallopeptidase domain
VIAWALTYLLHSTLLILAAWALGRTAWGRGSRTGDAIWKCALVGALVTATLHHAIGASTSLALPVHVAGTRASIDLGMPARAGGVLPWVALAWAAVSAIAAVRLARGWIHLRRAAGPRRVMSRGPLRRELDAILKNDGVTRRVTLSCSRGLTSPRAIGAYEICVPIRALRELSPAEQRALLAHEAAHLLRHDGAWLFVAALLQTFAWWQPLTRLAVARLGHAMELCCDDWAASRLPDRMALAACLVKVGEWGVPVTGGFPLAAMAVHGSALRERVERLIDSDRLERRAGRGRLVAALPLIAVLGLAPRVTLADISVMPSLAAVVTAAAAMPPAATAPVRDSLPLGPIPRRGARPAARPVAPAQQASSEVSDASSRLAFSASPLETARPPASDVTPIITMPEPLLRPSPGLRAASAAARIVPSAPTRPQPLVVKADLERRVGMWLDYQRRNPSLDPLRPNYDWRD